MTETFDNNEFDPPVGHPLEPKKGLPPIKRTPQDKKQLSYAKDRRNSYCENDKASRKNIPRHKAREHRGNRRKAKQLSANIERMEEVEGDLAQNGLIGEIERIGGWQKDADTPLGIFVADKMKARVYRRLRHPPKSDPPTGD